MALQISPALRNKMLDGIGIPQAISSWLRDYLWIHPTHSSNTEQGLVITLVPWVSFEAVMNQAILSTNPIDLEVVRWIDRPEHSIFITLI